MTKPAEFDQMRGGYLSLLASMEYHINMLLVELLEPKHGSLKLLDWLTAANISFRSKINLLQSLIPPDSVPKPIDKLCVELIALQDYRNILAHSFQQGTATITARGRQISDSVVSLEAIENKVLAAEKALQLIFALWNDLNIGEIPPFSADDFADWPP